MENKFVQTQLAGVFGIIGGIAASIVWPLLTNYAYNKHLVFFIGLFAGLTIGYMVGGAIKSSSLAQRLNKFFYIFNMIIIILALIGTFTTTILFLFYEMSGAMFLSIVFFALCAIIFIKHRTNLF